MKSRKVYQINVRYWVVLFGIILPNALFPIEQNTNLKQRIDEQFGIEKKQLFIIHSLHYPDFLNS